MRIETVPREEIEAALAQREFCSRLRARLTQEQCKRNQKRVDKKGIVLDSPPPELEHCRLCPGLGQPEPEPSSRKKDLPREPGPGERRCRECQEIKPLEEFRPQKHERKAKNPKRYTFCSNCEGVSKGGCKKQRI